MVLNIVAVGALLTVLFYVHTRVVKVTQVTTGSMRPTILPGDRLLVALGAYRSRAPRRGDIIAFWDLHNREYEVKRVIGEPGDTIVIIWGRVFRNGRRLGEPYIADPMIPEIPDKWAVGPDQYFVMGDNRNDSEDSRDFGPISRDEIIGRVFYRLLPLRRAGSIH